LVLAGCAVLAVLALSGGIVFAKYYSVNFREGISVASGLYFDSDKMETVTGTTVDLEYIKENEADALPINVNTSKWTGGADTIFDIEVRNYENHLLYNDANLDVEYAIRFVLLDVPTGANYYIRKMENGEEWQTLYEENADGTVAVPTDTNGIGFTGALPGGTLSQDTYRLMIQMVDPERYEAGSQARVLAVAYPTAPDYVKNDDNQQNRLLGIFQGVYSEISLSVESAAFQVQSESDYETNWQERVNDLSGLLYNIKTKGDVVTDDSSISIKPQVIIRWRGEYLKISEYDEYYLAAKLDDPAGIGTYTDGAWTCMKVSAMPYTSIDVTFYKTDLFMTEMTAGTLTKTDFEGLVTAEAVAD
ncbi:MAG: hypothetical protein IJ236_05045, partial [Oscillospiraceae bacterium]|nr:hypothetical protein [Oscillospiraceae bacterium]